MDVEGRFFRSSVSCCTSAKIRLLILLTLLTNVLGELRTLYFGDAPLARNGFDSSIADGTIIVHPDQEQDYEGTVEAWEIYAGNHSGAAVRLTVWRPETVFSTNKKYKLIGSSLWFTPSPGDNNYTLGNDRIAVLKNDIMGYQWRHANILTYEDMACSSSSFYYRFYSGHVDFAADTFYEFQTKGSTEQPCRKVSSRVTVKSVVCPRVTTTTILSNIAPVGSPVKYQANTHECWILQMSGTSQVYRFLHLKFGSGNFETQTSCTKDYVTIRNGSLSTSPELMKWCNGNRPDTLDSPDRYLFVSFVSDATNEGSGFSLSHQEATDATICTALTASTNNQTFNSHAGYPTSSYPIYSRACWVITGPAGKTLLVSVTDLELQNSTGCTKDYLSIRNGPYRTSSEFGRYCGTTKPSTLSSVSNQVHVYFHSDDNQNFKGFQIRYLVYATNNDGCTAFSNVVTGVNSDKLISPNYPSEYAANTDKCWRLEAASTKMILLTVDESVMEESSSCSKDYLEVRDGPGSSSQEMLKWCGALNPGLLITSGNNMYVRFRSDGSNQAKGFQMRFTAIDKLVCRTSTASTSERLFVNLNYPANMDACNVFQSSTRIKIRVKIFVVEPSTNCYNDFLELRDGASSSSPLLDRLCGNVSVTEYESSGNRLYYYFHSNHANNFYGYQLGFTAVSGTKIPTYFATAIASTLMSPNHPSSYPLNYQSSWIIKAKDSSELVVFEILNMDIEESNKCEHDYLSVRDGDTASAKSLAQYCGIKSNERVESSGQSIYVTFKSDATGVRSGFKVAYYTKTKPVVNEAEESKKKKLKIAMWVGIALAVIVVIVILAVLEAKYCMKKKNKNKVKPLNPSPRQSEPPHRHAQVRSMPPGEAVHFRNTQQVAPPAYDNAAPPAYDDINNSNSGAQRY